MNSIVKISHLGSGIMMPTQTAKYLVQAPTMSGVRGQGLQDT